MIEAAPRIPEHLLLSDLTLEQRDVLMLFYERSINSQLAKWLRNWRMPGQVAFEPLSIAQRVERELWNLGLVARVYANPHRDGVIYGYCISAQGFDWYKQQMIVEGGK